MIKILLLSDINSVHTQKWAEGLAQNNYIIGIFTLSAPTKNEWWKRYSNIQLLNDSNIYKNRSIFNKLKYLLYLEKLKQTIQKFEPDILHAHYATSYGLLGALSQFHPYVISVWGSDVFDFPKRNILYKQILKYNLKCADIITSTSHIMAQETRKYTNKKIHVIPFGVDTELFRPMENDENKNNKKDKIVIGTVKTLSPKYGIDVLIKAFHLLLNKHPNWQLELKIVGDGYQRKKLEQLVHKLNIKDKVTFYGKVENHKVPEILNTIDIFTVFSREESFGVAAVEAMACKKPVIASNVSGFREVIVHNESGIIIQKENVTEAATALEYLIQNPETARKISDNARKRVLELYDFKKNLQQMIQVYNQLV